MTAETQTTESSELLSGGQPAPGSQMVWTVSSTPESVSPGEALPQAVVAPPRRKLAIFKQIISLLCLCALALASYFGVSHFLVQSVRVVGSSMVPTLHDSENYLLNRWIYYTRGPKRTEIVVLRDPSDNGFSVKRVVGMAGDSIFLKDGGVYVNGQQLSEPYLPSGTFTDTGEKFRNKLIVCGTGQFFVLGDNRNNSIDSRVYGPVPRQNILGLIVR